ncbi:MAG: transcriptional regulator FtrA [Pseudomonadota bacterium]
MNFSPAPLVCVVAYDGLCTFEFGITVELFGLPRPEFDHWYRFAVVAAEPGPLRATGGVTVRTSHGLDALDDAHLILVPGWRGTDIPVPPDLSAALRRAHERGARLASICSGAFVLAAAGLLNGRRATTHWRYAQALARTYPDIDVDPEVLFVEDRGIMTSAGSAAGLDLGLHIIRQDFGAGIANMVARRLVLPARREGGQRQFVPAPEPRSRGGRIAPLLDRIRSSLNEEWPLARMASEAGLSGRTLSRRMIEATGTSPLMWLTQARVSHAGELLERADLSLADIAEACGFGSMETFRREFRRANGVAPSRYRSQFTQRERV